MTEPDSVVISPVSGSREMSAFIQLPRRLYAGLPGYVASLDMEQKDLLDPKHSAFYRHGHGCYFLAWRNGRPVGRISAQVDCLEQALPRPRTGFFGAFDTLEPNVGKALLDAAIAWLKEQGMERVRGPWTLNSNGEYGVMVDGQKAMPMIMMPWHPAELAGIIEQAGFTRAMDVLSYQMEMGPAAEAAHIIPRGLQPGKGNLGDVTIRQMRRKQLMEDGEILRSLYNETWQDTWGFLPYTADEMATMIKQIKPILRDEHLVLVEKAGKPVAVALVVPNLFDIAGDLGGAPSPLGWVKLGVRLLRHRFRSARVILLGVSVSVANTAFGAMLPALVISELMKRGRGLPYKHIELGWILETNMPMRRLVERIVPEPCKRHRIYEKSLVASEAMPTDA